MGLDKFLFTTDQVLFSATTSRPDFSTFDGL